MSISTEGIVKLTTIIRVDYDNSYYSKVLQEVVGLGYRIRIRDIVIRQKSLRHFHVTLILRKPIPFINAVDIVDKYTTCDRKYIDWVVSADGFSIRETPDYRDITSEMEGSLYRYFVDNGLPYNWKHWYAMMNTQYISRASTISEFEERLERKKDAKIREMIIIAYVVKKLGKQIEELPEEVDDIYDFDIIPVDPRGLEEE